VGRVWAFNTRLPFGPGQYDEEQFKHLDYIVASAAKHDIKLVLALGNLWNAYMAPEDFLRWASGSASGWLCQEPGLSLCAR
jgi:mannan endo-1,4-beta-mannosidase